MASISSTNVNEFLPGLEEFLRTMVSSPNLNTDHRQIATMYLDKLDHLSQLTTQASSSITDDPSLMNTEIISDNESDDFTDEDEEQQQALQNSTPTPIDHQSTLDHSQWYKTDDCQPLNEEHDICSLKRPSSNILADGLLLTYDKNQQWICRYYVLDNFDLICFSSERISQTNCSPLWVSDMTNAKIHLTTIEKIQCLCLQIGLAEAIYLRPSDSNQIHYWLRVFREAISSSKVKETSKSRTNVKTLSRNARRMFAQFNRKKGQLVSHLLDQMANVTGVDDKTRKHYELRGFLIISLDNSSFTTKYCTILDGIFRIHKSRLSDQMDHQFDLKSCTLSFPEERTRDIQFALMNKDNQKIFIRGNNIYTMGRLLNTLAKYVEITGSSQRVFNRDKSSPPHVYSDLDLPSNMMKNLSINTPTMKNIYHSASQFYEGRSTLERNSTPIQHETYDQPKFSIDQISSNLDRNNNQISIPPRPRDRTKNEYSLPISQSSINISSFDSKSIQHPPPPPPLPRRSSIEYTNKLTKSSNERHMSTQTYETMPSAIRRRSNQIQAARSKHFYDIPVVIERPTRFVIPPFDRYDKSTSMMNDREDEDVTIYDNLSKSDGIGQFRFVIPFNHSPRSAFTSIKPIHSPTDSISSNSTLPQTSSSSSSSYSNSNNNNNSNPRRRLMTAV